MLEPQPISSVDAGVAPNRKRRLPAWARGCLLVLFINVAGFSAILSYFMWRLHEDSQCRENLRCLTDAVRLYAFNNQGALPQSLELMVPNYITSLPRCPTFSSTGYRINLRKNSLNPGVPPPERYDLEQLLESQEQSHEKIHYRIFCSGHCHPNWGINEPSFDDEFGFGPSNDGL